MSVATAHVWLIFRPDSAFPGRLVAPLAGGLEFLDTHWKAVLLLVAPILSPIIRDLVPRLRKAGSFEFDAVPLETVGVREKPTRAQQGGAQ